MNQTLISNLEPPSVAAAVTGVPEGIIRALVEFGAVTDYGVSAGEVLVSVGQLCRVRDTPSTESHRAPLLAGQSTGSPMLAFAATPERTEKA
jgi:hypothetical protein